MIDTFLADIAAERGKFPQAGDIVGRKRYFCQNHMIMNKFTAFAALVLCLIAAPCASAQESVTLLNNGWKFAYGNSASMEADFTHGTEYFTYIAKAQTSGHSHSPIMKEFDDSGWQDVSLPHDWVVDLPYSGEASHSHGYKCVGWKYPGNSIGWYRKHLFVPAGDKGMQLEIEFEGIYRDSEVFCNGFLLGHERSGYTSRVYDLSPYLVYGGDNVITVRCSAMLEEGWYYEGGGIYRNVRLHRTGAVGMKPYSLKINKKEENGKPYVDKSCISMDYIFRSAAVSPEPVSCELAILDAEGNGTERADHPWSIEDPYLYTLNIRLSYDGKPSAMYNVKFGVRTATFDSKEGFLLNGRPVKLKGCNLHLDHAGVGTGVPDELWRYRILRLKEFGFNAIRSSHNCASPAMLDLCDELGMLVIDENREFGINDWQMSQLAAMIARDRNHPSVVMWSVGNEEWALEWSEDGTEIARIMSDYANALDSSRPATYGNSGGRELVKGVDVFGYNYIVQNPVDEYHEAFPGHCAVGTEETSGAGTRGHYTTVPEKGWMAPLNRADTAGRVNVIEHGWKFYKARPWAAGLFYWTGQDYRGEPNPMKWPATGSQFGILDYCCFPKDEAFYLKSVWTGEPMVHICGPCNGEVWVYSNCDEVALYADGRRLSRQRMPEDGHLVWKVTGRENAMFTARGYRNGKPAASDSYPNIPEETSWSLSRESMKADGQDVVVVDIFSPEECLEVIVENAELLGWGNGDPGFKEKERPAAGDGNRLLVKPFSGCAQIIVRSREGSSGDAVVHIGARSFKIHLI